MTDAAQFYANRVLKEFKEKDSMHAEWVKVWLKILTELHNYVKQHHTTGLSWSGHVQRDSLRNGSSSNPPTTLPKPSMTDKFSNVQITEDQPQNAIMSSINSLGTNATFHLKKVPEELKVHKNPNLREAPVEKSVKSSVCLSDLEL